MPCLLVTLLFVSFLRFLRSSRRLLCAAICVLVHIDTKLWLRTRLDPFCDGAAI